VLDDQRREKKTMPDNGKLLMLAQHLLPEDKSLVEEINLAVQKPLGYLSAFQARLHQRGISTPVPQLPWIALVDGLCARGKLIEVDWRGASEDVMLGIDRLSSGQPLEANRWAWVDVGAWEERGTEDFLQAIGDWLGKRGLALASLNIQSDSYPLIILEAGRVEKSQQLAQQAGYGSIERWSETED
jgi:hypothetical protein